MIVVLIDPLVWQAGIEYGLQALAELQRRHVQWRWTAYLRDSGPFVEAVAFAVHELGLESRIRYCPRLTSRLRPGAVVLAPRVFPLEQMSIRQTLESGCSVVTTDPGLDWGHARMFHAPRRDWRALADCLERLARATPSPSSPGMQ